MRSSEDPKNYQYTFYSSSTNNNTSSPSSSLPTWQNSTYSSPVGNFTTIHTATVSNILPEPPQKHINQPIIKEQPSMPKTNTLADLKSKSQEQNSPLTFPYINPQCGIDMSGKSGFDIKGNYVTIKVGKVTNTRNGGQSGTLQLQLIRMSYFYDGKQLIKPQQYTSVCTAQIGQLQGGWSFSDVLRGGIKRVDNPNESSYRKRFILLLQEYLQGNYKIVDYMNFD